MTKIKKASVAKLKLKADAVFSKYVRLRDSDKYGYASCITCETKKYWKELQNGHFVKRSVNFLRFNEQNCNAQCYSCNVMRYGEQYLYAQAIDKKYGDGTAEKLMIQRYTLHKFTVSELEQLISDTMVLLEDYERLM